ncbi:hypothetical protein QM716_23370 [Rhodococcus sp. IEGM 1409]|uniref:hypothetical protein n=1 Tax=Rhodococcus sp. IEGM 1409 TaxID=3047082 RepID=UPI0024B72D03|nr:hypothetical protein [Rhodococcus sp. IEGM 1409]MDI9902802.1 hypothetical protein [Rhodococcus sp. IEGM 1409]
MKNPDMIALAVLGVLAVLAVLFMAFSESAFVFGASFAAVVFIAARAVQILFHRWRRQQRRAV